MNFQFTPYLPSISKCKLNVHEADTNCIQNSYTLLLIDSTNILKYFAKFLKSKSMSRFDIFYIRKKNRLDSLNLCLYSMFASKNIFTNKEHVLALTINQSGEL